MNAFLGKGSIIAFWILQCTAANGQPDLSKYQIGLSAGMFIYQGDLTPSQFGSFKTPGFTGSVFINRILNPSFSIRGNIALGKLFGNDAKYSVPAWRQERNFKFFSPVFETSVLVVWNPIGSNHVLYPYVFGGGGISFVWIRPDWSSFNPEYFSAEPNVIAGLNEDIAHSPPRLIPVIPLGAGLQYNFSQKLAFIAESSYRLTSTDYLDGFSKAANPDKFDHYQNYSVGLVLKFGKKAGIDCPVVRQ